MSTPEENGEHSESMHQHDRVANRYDGRLRKFVEPGNPFERAPREFDNGLLFVLWLH